MKSQVLKKGKTPTKKRIAFANYLKFQKLNLMCEVLNLAILYFSFNCKEENIFVEKQQSTQDAWYYQFTINNLFPFLFTLTSYSLQ